jgi:hypothetical protein
VSKQSKRQLFEVKTALSPGETVSLSGVYRVVHTEHRPDHFVVVVSRDVLPACRICGGNVTFHLERSVDYAPHDWDLAGPLMNSKAASE